MSRILTFSDMLRQFLTYGAGVNFRCDHVNNLKHESTSVWFVIRTLSNSEHSGAWEMWRCQADRRERIEVPEILLIGFDVNRSLYFWIILIITVIALLGNVLVVRTVIFRKYKHLQKTCIISLAISDIITVILFSMNNLDLLSKKRMTWIYGEYMCHYMPVGQVLGNLTSSVALLVIALDRYHNVIHVISKKWDPCLWKCICGGFALWIICAGYPTRLSYPVVTFYIYFPILINEVDEAAMCTGAPVTKSTIFLYYICMNCLFFLPIVLMFFWFYYKIAILIWRHRKPPAEQLNQQEITETSCTSKPTQTQDSCVSINKSTDKKKKVQMEKKIRSFKIVVTLIIAFIGCRMPYWLIMLYQQAKSVDRNILWNLRFSATSLYLLNCVLNPLLYTYLNVTIVACRKITKFLANTCCCWCSNSEFEDFETGKHTAEGIMRVENNDVGINADKLNDDRLKVQFLDVPIPKYKEKEVY